jgi:DNA-binding transcriptional regulator GbsR (MarR family)
MNKTLQRVREDVLAGLGELTDYMGFGRVIGQLYSALLMSQHPLCLDDLESIVGKSKSSVSSNMRNLERWRMAHEVWVKGERRKFYEAETDIWDIVTYVLGSRELNKVRAAVVVLKEDLDRLQSARAALNEEDRHLADLYQTRVRELLKFFRLAELILESIVASEAPRDVMTSSADDTLTPS